MEATQRLSENGPRIPNCASLTQPTLLGNPAQVGPVFYLLTCRLQQRTVWSLDEEAKSVLSVLTARSVTSARCPRHVHRSSAVSMDQICAAATRSVSEGAAREAGAVC